MKNSYSLIYPAFTQYFAVLFILNPNYQLFLLVCLYELFFLNFLFIHFDEAAHHMCF
jgi:hypothetical protein